VIIFSAVPREIGNNWCHRCTGRNKSLKALWYENTAVRCEIAGAVKQGNIIEEQKSRK
jgi:hypothetical protein